MNKGFIKYIGDNHPDPDSLIHNENVFNQLCLLAENYKTDKIKKDKHKLLIDLCAKTQRLMFRIKYGIL